MSRHRGAGAVAATLVAALGAALLVACAPDDSARQVTAINSASATVIPTATPAPAPTVDFPEPVEVPEEPPPVESRGSRSAPAPSATTVHAGIEDRLFALANEARAAAGVGSLQRLGGLDGVARGWSEHLAGGGHDLAHNPSYSTQIPGGWSTAGENVAWIDDGGRLSAEEVATSIHQGWMDSPGHRDNILNPAFTHLGVGVAQGSRGYYLTQNFAAY